MELTEDEQLKAIRYKLRYGKDIRPIIWQCIRCGLHGLGGHSTCGWCPKCDAPRETPECTCLHSKI